MHAYLFSVWQNKHLALERLYFCMIIFDHIHIWIIKICTANDITAYTSQNILQFPITLLRCICDRRNKSVLDTKKTPYFTYISLCKILNTTFRTCLISFSYFYVQRHLSVWSVSPSYLIFPWGRDEIEAILQTTFSNAFAWMKMYESRLRFHWFQHWFR